MEETEECVGEAEGDPKAKGWETCTKWRPLTWVNGAERERKGTNVCSSAKWTSEKNSGRAVSRELMAG